MDGELVAALAAERHAGACASRLRRRASLRGAPPCAEARRSRSRRRSNRLWVPHRHRGQRVAAVRGLCTIAIPRIGAAWRCAMRVAAQESDATPAREEPRRSALAARGAAQRVAAREARPELASLVDARRARGVPVLLDDATTHAGKAMAGRSLALDALPDCRRARGRTGCVADGAGHGFRTQDTPCAWSKPARRGARLAHRLLLHGRRLRRRPVLDTATYSGAGRRGRLVHGGRVMTRVEAAVLETAARRHPAARPRAGAADVAVVTPRERRPLRRVPAFTISRR